MQSTSSDPEEFLSGQTSGPSSEVATQALDAASAEQSKAAEAFRSYQEVRSFGSLDGLRCLSICAVIWHHYSIPAIQEAVPATLRGFMGVDLFFVISGYLIVTLILRERDRTGEIHLKEFYARRAVRIFPLYYAVLGFFALKAVARGVDLPRSQDYLEDLPILATYMANWFHGNGTYALAWSLSAEEQFYALCPPLEKWAKRFVIPVLLGLILISWAISFQLIDPLLESAFGWSSDEPTMLRQTTFVPILLGVALAHLLHKRDTFAKLWAIVGHKATSAALMVVIFVQLNLFQGEMRGIPAALVHLSMFCLVASCAIREDHGTSRLLSWKPIAHIGKLSYGIYLLHHIGMDLGFKAANTVGLGSTPLRLVFGLIAVYLLAEASYRLLEKPLLKLRSKHRP